MFCLSHIPIIASVVTATALGGSEQINDFPNGDIESRGFDSMTTLSKLSGITHGTFMLLRLHIAVINSVESRLTERIEATPIKSTRNELKTIRRGLEGTRTPVIRDLALVKGAKKALKRAAKFPIRSLHSAELSEISFGSLWEVLSHGKEQIASTCNFLNSMRSIRNSRSLKLKWIVGEEAVRLDALKARADMIFEELKLLVEEVYAPILGHADSSDATAAHSDGAGDPSLTMVADPGQGPAV
jgi:hypothetical protein